MSSTENSRKRRYSLRNSMTESLSNSLNVMFTKSKKQRLNNGQAGDLTSMEVLDAESLSYNYCEFNEVPANQKHSGMKQRADFCFRNVSYLQQDCFECDIWENNHRVPSVYTRDGPELSDQQISTVSSCHITTGDFLSKRFQHLNRNCIDDKQLSNSRSFLSISQFMNSSHPTKASSNESRLFSKKVDRKGSGKKLLNQFKTLFHLKKKSSGSTQTCEIDDVETLEELKSRIVPQVDPNESPETRKRRSQIASKILSSIYIQDDEQEATDDLKKFRRERFASDHFLHLASNEDLIGSLTLIMDEDPSLFDIEETETSMDTTVDTTVDDSINLKAIDVCSIDYSSKLENLLENKQETKSKETLDMKEFTETQDKKASGNFTFSTPNISYELFVNRSVESLTNSNKTDSSSKELESSDSKLVLDKLPELSIREKENNKEVKVHGSQHSRRKSSRRHQKEACNKELPQPPEEDIVDSYLNDSSLHKEVTETLSDSSNISTSTQIDDEECGRLPQATSKPEDDVPPSLNLSSSESVDSKHAINSERNSSIEPKDQILPVGINQFEKPNKVCMRNNFIQELGIVNKSECLSVISEKSFDECIPKESQFPSDPTEDLDDLIYNNYIHTEANSNTNTNRISSEFTGSRVSDIPRDRYSSKLGYSYPHQIIYPHERFNSFENTTSVGYPYGGKVFYHDHTGKRIDQYDISTSVYAPRYQVQRSISMPYSKVRQATKKYNSFSC